MTKLPLVLGVSAALILSACVNSAPEEIRRAPPPAQEMPQPPVQPVPFQPVQGTPPPAPAINPPSAEDPDAIHTNVGDKFGVTLASNASTGYKWDVASYDKDIVTLVSDTYIPADKKKPGAGGKQEFVFTATKAGTTFVQFKYERSWEKNKPAEVRGVTVYVN